MTSSSSKQFGLIVAYLLPGFIGLAGMAPLFPVVGQWLRPGIAGGLDVGAPVYAVMAAMTVGMILSCVRWLLVDHLHHRTGIVPPVWNDRRLDERLAAFDYLVEAHYRYYQFYANALVAIAWVYGVNRLLGTWPLLGLGTDLAAIVLCCVLFAGSRDALAKYYARTSRLVGQVAKGISGDAMTNGNHHEQMGGAASPRPMPKPQDKPQTPAKPQAPSQQK